MGRNKRRSVYPKKKQNRNASKVVAIFLAIIVIWGVIAVTDYRHVCHNFEKPMFAIATGTADDGGSGTYIGLGYSFEIQGSFMPEDENPGVTRASFYLLGFKLSEAVRE